MTFDQRRNARLTLNENILIGSEYQAVDLSESGIKLNSGYEVRRGEKLNLTFNLNGTEIKTTGEVMWCSRSTSIFQSGWMIGIQFVHLSISSQLDIRKYIASHTESMIA